MLGIAISWDAVSAVADIIGVVLVLAALCAAFIANRISRKSNEGQLRAYIRIDPGAAPAPALLPALGHVHFEILNYGQTPAQVLSVEGMSVLARHPLPPNFSISSGQWNVLGEQFILHKDVKRDASMPVRLTQAEAQDVLSPSIPCTIVVVVRVKYRDAFGHKRLEQNCWHVSYTNDQPRNSEANQHSIST
jgi:hypothetical protein